MENILFSLGIDLQELADKLDNTFFCEHCMTFPSVHLELTTDSKAYHGSILTYGRIRCICKECGDECFPLDLIDVNKRLYEEAVKQFRTDHGVVSQEIIDKIPQMYAIGIRPLSLVLGWGELTYTRFFKGDCPSDEYSDLLLTIYNDPKSYRELLCKNNDLISKSAFRKSLATVNKLIDDIDCGSTELLLVALIRKIFPDTSSIALQKLLYYIQGFYAAFSDMNCIQAKCFAWARGPVYASIYYLNAEELIDEKVNEVISQSKSSPRAMELSESLQEIASIVVRSFGVYSGDILTKFTHIEQPWLTIRVIRDGNDRSEIPFDVIKDSFVDICKEYHITSAQEIRKYASAMFSRIAAET